MYPVILIGVDGDDAGRDAIAVARHLVGDYDRLTLVDVRRDRLHDLAEREGADLIIVGRALRSALHRAPCTVAVAPAGYADRARPPSRVGVAYDGSAHSKIALQHAMRLADRHGASVAAMDVVQLPLYAEVGAWSLVNRTDLQLADVRSGLGDIGDVDVEITVGMTHDALLDFSETVDALFCGSRRYGVLQRVELGSTSDQLAQHAACPLFVTTSH